jgi:hypothetical protein
MEPIQVRHDKRPYTASLENIGGDPGGRSPAPCVHHGKKLVARLMPNGGTYDGLTIKGDGQVYDRHGHYGYINKDYLPILSAILGKVTQKAADDPFVFQKFIDAQNLVENLEGRVFAK